MLTSSLITLSVPNSVFCMFLYDTWYNLVFTKIFLTTNFPNLSEPS